MRRRGPYDTAAAWVHGQWFFAHDRVEQIGHRLDELGLDGGGDERAARVEFFFSFRSPYSYLAAPRAFALPERFDVELAYRGVIPMAMRGQAVPRAKRLHTLRDVDREAARLGLPFGRIHDPIGAGARCAACSSPSTRSTWGASASFVLEASRGIWAEAVDVARDAGLRAVSERAGLDWDACRAALEDPALRARVDAEHRRAWTSWATGACRCSSSRASCSGARTTSTTSRPSCARRAWSADARAGSPAQPRAAHHRPAARAAALAGATRRGSTR